jgi:N-acyl-D-amino-acid deacylase
MNRLVRRVLILVASSAINVEATWAAESPRDSIRRAVDRGLVVLERGARAYPSNQSCFACHHQTLPILAMMAARDTNLRFDAELLREQRLFTRKSFESRKDRLAKGEHVGGRAATVSYGLWTLHLAGDPPDELTEAMTAYLLSVQQPDGHWKPQSIRPPLEVSLVSCTVLSAASVQRFASAAQQERATAAIARARTWLTTAALEEQEDLNFALWGEKLLHGTEERANKFVERILAARQADGGWSQNSALTSDAYATGQTLFVLMEAGMAADEAPIREGTAFLLETQQDDGSWHVVTRSKPIQPWFDNGDPHDKDQFISFTATGWATAALARALRD